MRAFILFLFFIECMIQRAAAQCCLQFESLACVSCPDGLHLYRNNCIYDLPNCLEYQGGFDCALCQTGYILNTEDNKCVLFTGGGNTTDPIVPTTGFSPVAYMQFQKQPILSLDTLAKTLAPSGTTSIELFRAYVRNEGTNRIYRLVYSTDQGFMETVISKPDVGQQRILNVKVFNKSADEKFIDLFSDPYYPSIQQYIAANFPSLSSFEIIDGFKNIQDDGNQTYRIFVIDSNSGLREINVTVNQTPVIDNNTVITELDINALDPLFVSILQNLIKSPTFLALQQQKLTSFQKIVQNGTNTTYNATFSTLTGSASFVYFQVDEIKNKVNIFGYFISDGSNKPVDNGTELNCSILVQNVKEPNNLQLTSVEFNETDFVPGSIPTDVFESISSFKNKFYPETAGTNINQLLIAENSTAVIYEILYSKANANQTFYSMTFSISKNDCNRTFDLVEFYSYNKSQIVNISINTTDPTAIKDTITAVNKNYTQIYNFVSFINPPARNGIFKEMTIINVNQTHRRYSFKYDFTEDALPGYQSVTYRVKQYDSPTVKIAGNIKKPVEKYVEVPLQLSMKMTFDKYFEGLGISAKYIKTMVSLSNGARLRYFYVIGNQLVVYQIDTSLGFRPIQISRTPYIPTIIDPTPVPPTNTTDQPKTISIADILSNMTLMRAQQYTEELFRPEIQQKNLLFNNLRQLTANKSNEILEITYKNSQGDSLVIQLLLDLVNGEINIIKKSTMMGGGDGVVEPPIGNQTAMPNGNESTMPNGNVSTMVPVVIETNNVTAGNNIPTSPGDNNNSANSNVTDNENQTIKGQIETGNETDVMDNQTVTGNQTTTIADNQTVANNSNNNNGSNNNISNNSNINNNSNGSIINNNNNSNYSNNTTDIQQPLKPSLIQLAQQASMMFSGYTNTLKQLTSIDINNTTNIQQQISNITIDPTSLIVITNQQISYNFSQGQLQITTAPIPQPIAQPQDTELSTNAVAQWLQIPQAKLANTSILSKQMYGGDGIIRYTVRFVNTGLLSDVDTFVFVFGADADVAGRNYPVKAVSEVYAKDIEGSQFLDVQIAGQDVARVARMVLGRSSVVRGQRRSRDGSITLVDVLHVSYGRVQLYLKQEEGQYKVVGIYFVDNGSAISYSSDKPLPSVVKQIDSALKIQLAKSQTTISPQIQPLNFSYLLAKPLAFSPNKTQLQIYYKQYPQSSSSSSALYKIKALATFDPPNQLSSVKITQLTKIPTNRSALTLQRRQQRQERTKDITSQLSYRSPYEKLIRQYGHYLVGLRVLRVEVLLSSGSQKRYRITFGNEQGYMSAVVSYAQERSNILSLTTLPKQNLNSLISSQQTGCSQQKLIGQCVQCLPGFSMNADKHCYQLQPNCELQQDSVCLRCSRGFIQVGQSCR